MAPSSRKRVVDRAYAGDPPKTILGLVETITFTIYDFKEIQRGKDPIKSPVLKAHGLNWVIWCYPMGYSSSFESHVSCYLQCSPTKDATAVFSFRVKDFQPESFKYKFKPKCELRGFADFLDLSNVGEYIECDGSLIIEVDIQIASAAERKDVWYPKSLEQQGILVSLYQNAASSETSDIIFCVGGSEYHAHKSILALRCRNLYDIAKECRCDEQIVIESTNAEIFKGVLDFAYTVKYPEIQNKNTAMELLIAADCYDSIHLKLYVESVMVERFVTPENAAELLLFADSYSCALLKEAATNAFIMDAAIVKTSDEWSKVQESSRLLMELLDAVTCSDKSTTGRDTDGIDWMDVGTLRNELEKVDLLLDGSREVLVERLRMHRTEQKGEEAGSVK